MKMPKQIPCDLCPKIFATWSGLRHHKQTHNGVKKYGCLQCNKSFSRNMKTHSLIHSGEKPHKCTHWNFSSSQSSNLKTHIKNHTEEKLYNCNQCQYKTADSGNLQTHRMTHSRAKPHICAICGYSRITFENSVITKVGNVDIPSYQDSPPIDCPPRGQSWGGEY